MPARYIKSLSKKEFADFLGSFDHILTDCDGVLWLGNKIISGSPDTVKQFQKLGKKVYYVTNNSTKTRKEYVTKCEKLGYEATEESILSSAYLTACYFQQIQFNKKVYIVGSTGISQELDTVGIKSIGVGPEPMRSDSDIISVLEGTQLDPDVGAVVVGFDEHFSFPKMVKALSYIKQPNNLFVATNTDELFPTSFPHLAAPGTGTFVKAIETGAGKEAFKIGKPSPYLCEAIVKRHNVDPARTLMIGDRSNTDILFGARCGFKTLLVLSGVTTLEEVEQWEKSGAQEDKLLVPDYYVENLGELFPLL